MIFNKIHALRTLTSSVKYNVKGDVIEWYDPDMIQPSEADITIEIARLTTEYDGLEYSRLRKAEYNKLEQDEMRYDDLINGTTTWKDAILSIKALYPKPL